MSPAAAPRPAARETFWLLVAALVCLAPRIAFAYAMPTIPYVDFEGLVRFAVALNQPGWPGTKLLFWQFNVGLPVALSLVLRVVPGAPADVARYAGAVVTGLAALAPFVIWRGAFRFSTRMASALLLGLWPSHVFFSGVVAQCNWILLPSVALAALAARCLVRGEAWPLSSAVLFCAAGVTRQEMLIALLPAALVAAGAFAPSGRRGRRLAVWSVATAALLLAAATFRFAGSGRFAIGTGHAGNGMLGVVTPGAGSAYTTNAEVYYAAHDPDAWSNFDGMRNRGMALALREMARRPFFHSVRMFAAGANSVLDTDAAILYHTVTPEAMSPSHQARGRALFDFLYRPLAQTAGIVLGVFFGAVLCRLGPRGPMLVLASVILLKIGVHTLTVAQARYFVVVGALALLGLALVIGERGPETTRARVARAVLAGLLLAFVARRLGVLTETYVVEHEEQLTYRFWVWSPPPIPPLKCTMASGLLQAQGGPPTIRLLRPNPSPGDEASVECVLQGVPPPMALEVLDSYAVGGLPGRIVQSVVVDGREVLCHDIGAEPGTGWVRVPLADGPGHAPHTIAVSVRAINPDPGADWGKSARATFRLVPL